MATANTSSPESKTFHSHYAILADQLSGNQAVILPFATHLYTNNVIDKTVHQNVQDSRNPPYERAVAILSAIESIKMKLSPQETFKALILALRKVDLKMTASKLLEDLEANGGTVDPELLALHSTNDSTSPITTTPAGDSSLPDTEPDINDLMNFVAVHVEGDKWKMIATSLKFEQSEIEAISIENDYEVLECCRDMFIKWRSKANPHYLWSVLIQTLCSPTVGMNAVANEIGKKRDKLKESNKKYEVYQHLGSPSLSELMERIGTEAAAKWKGIGSELGLSSSTLGSIGRRNRDDMMRMMDVFSKWQAQLTTPNNWTSLLIALSSPQVKELKLVEIIISHLKK